MSINLQDHRLHIAYRKVHCPSCGIRLKDADADQCTDCRESEALREAAMVTAGQGRTGHDSEVFALKCAAVLAVAIVVWIVWHWMKK